MFGRGVGLPPPEGMEDLTLAGAGLLRLEDRRAGRLLHMLPHQRILPDTVRARRRLTRGALQRLVAMLAERTGDCAEELGATLDLGNLAGAGGPRLENTYPVPTVPDRPGGRSHGGPVKPPDLRCQYSFHAAVDAACSRGSGGLLLPDGRTSHTLSVHCHHGCNRTGQMVVCHAMALGGDPSLLALEQAVAAFARARSALGGSPAPRVGMYDAEAVWEVYRRHFFAPPVRLPSSSEEDENALASLPARFQPCARGGGAAYAAASARSCVPLPFSVECCATAGAESNAQDDPLSAVGARSEYLTTPLTGDSEHEVCSKVGGQPSDARSWGGRLEAFCSLPLCFPLQVLALIWRATCCKPNKKKRVMTSCMPHELVDCTLLTARHMVSPKADGVRALLVLTCQGVFLAMRNNNIQGVNICRPLDCSEAVLDVEVVLPQGSGARPLVLAFDLMLWRDARGADALAPWFTGGESPAERRAEALQHFLLAMRAAANVIQTHPAEGLRRWSSLCPAPRFLQSFDFDVKPFMCLCQTERLMRICRPGLRPGQRPPPRGLACRLCGAAAQGEGGVAQAPVGVVDGIVLVDRDSVHGPDCLMYKSKPVQTVDFTCALGRLYYTGPDDHPVRAGGGGGQSCLPT